MDIKRIPIGAQTLISASSYINNYIRAIEELVYNSIDAECTSIAIRLSIPESFIQILDNGIGIKKENFGLLGQKYATSKHIDVNTLKSDPDKYGFRGLSLACIIEVSQDVLISSRFYKSDETCLKTFHNGMEKEFCSANDRPSKGTTVEIRGFLYNLNIQRKSIDNVHELQNIQSSLEQLSLIHCNVSISLRDDYINKIIFKIHKSRDIYQTLWSLFEINRQEIQELQVEKNQYKVKAFISKGSVMKQYQWIYLNGKFVYKTELHKKVNKLLNKFLLKNIKDSKIKNKNDDCTKSDLPFYFIFISCPNCDFDITYKNKQTLVQFKEWTKIDKLIEKLIQFYCGESYLKQTVEEKQSNIEHTRMQVKNIVEKIFNNNGRQSRISSIQHGIKGKNIKRKNNIKNKQMDNNIPPKSQKFLNLKANQEIQIVKSNKENKDIKKAFKKPSYKNINKIKYKTKTSNKELKKIRNIDCLIDKFKKPTDSVKKRCEELSLEAQLQNIQNVGTPKNKILKFTYTTDINETMSYCNNKEIVTDTHFAKNKYLDNSFVNKNVDYVKPHTSYDLLQPFNQNYLTIPEQTEMQNALTPRVNNSKSCNSLHPKYTFDSHKNQNYSERKKNFQHFISSSSRRNFDLSNKSCTISHENSIITNKNFFKERYMRNNYNIEGVSNKNRIDNNAEMNVSYLHEYDDNYLDKINNISDKQLFLQSDFGKTFDTDEHSLAIVNAQNKAYSIHLSNSDNNIKLSCLEKESFLYKQNTEDVEETKSTMITNSPSNIKYLLSESIDPLSYCEIIFNGSERGNVEKEFINNSTTNGNINVTFSSELLEEGINKISDTNFLKNKNINDIEWGLKDPNLSLPNPDLNVNQINLTEDVNNFQLRKRHDFMPKGMSQIYKTRLRKHYDVSTTKIEYYETMVYNNFADDVLVNSEIFSPLPQNIDIKSRNSEKSHHRFDSIFNATSIKEAKVFGQIDRKFIATLIKGISPDSSLDFLVLFDQHAVDERIQLETNLADYFDGNIWSSIAFNSIPLKLDKHDFLYLYNHKLKFIQFGLEWEFLDDKILINAIPKAILGKNPRQEETVLKAVRSLILEEIDVIKSLGGNVTLYPKAIMDLVFNEACRYAIKFGDKLSKSDCVGMLKMLSTCKTPFQCAHGRPVMAVLIDIPIKNRIYKVNVDNVKRFKVRHSI